MTDPTVLAATWSDGVFVFSGETRWQELAAQSVFALKPDGHKGALAKVDGYSICQTGSEGSWTTIANRDRALAYRVTVGKAIYVGTDDDAPVLFLSEENELTILPSFDTVVRRDTWYAGSAVVNDQVLGTPPGIRFMSEISVGYVILSNAHVGSIQRSTDRGVTRPPTI